MTAFARLFLATLAACTVALTAQAQPVETDCPATAAAISALEANPDLPPLGELVLAFAKRRYADDCVSFNEIQVIGTHNSYHLQPQPALFAFMHAITDLVDAWEYSHLPLGEQLGTQQVRQFELDIYPDPEGGQFFFRLGPLLVGENPFGPLSLLAPGMKVVHVPHLDFETTCVSLVACLQEIEDWSQANPDHLPLMILVEAKSSALGGSPVAVELGLEGSDPGATPSFGTPELDSVDAEIRSVFSEAQLFTPDDLRGGHATLEQAVLTDGWPTLGTLRGQVMFALDNGGAERDAYLVGHPSLEGRVMFTNASPGDDDAAFVKRNDPLGSPGEITGLVEAGYLVRTRADTDTEQARSGDTTRRDAALASGAQFVSTDFPVPSTLPGFTDYAVQLPDNLPARCNPVTAPEGCRDDAL